MQSKKYQKKTVLPSLKAKEETGQEAEAVLPTLMRND